MTKILELTKNFNYVTEMVENMQDHMGNFSKEMDTKQMLEVKNNLTEMMNVLD